MPPRRVLMVPALLGCLTFQAPEADAQAGAFIGACARFIQGIAGSQLSASAVRRFMARQARNEAVGYIWREFVDSFAYGDRVELSRPQLDFLRHDYEARGMGECQLREDLQAILGGHRGPPPPPYDPRQGPPLPYDPHRGPFVPYDLEPPPVPSSTCLTQAGTCFMPPGFPPGQHCSCFILPFGPVPGVSR
jgi:hypothetical protein